MSTPARTKPLRQLAARLASLPAPSVRLLPLVVLAVLLAWVTSYKPYANWPAIRSDGVGYHAWTRAILLHDYSFCQWEGPEGFISFRDPARNFCQNKYPPGMAILQYPFMAPLVDLSPDAPLISEDEHQMCLTLGAITLWLTAALMCWSAALLRVPPGRSALVVTAVIVGTGLFHYGTYDASFTHGRAALFTALLLAFVVRERERGRPIPIAVLVLSGFFLTSLRMTNVFIPVELAIAYLWLNRHRFTYAAVRGVLPLGLGCAIAVGLQLAYNRYALGTYSTNSYGEESFLWDRPMQWEVMFSYERGLFTYYPLFALGVIAGFIAPAARGWTALLTVLIATYVVLYGYWHSWFLGGGMGHRGFVEIAPLVGIVLLLAVREARRAVFNAAATASLVCTAVTAQVMLAYWRGTYPMGGATPEMYWTELRTLESVLTGGTQCRPSRCDWLHAHCERVAEPEFRICAVNFGRPGVCTARGRCLPLVAIKSLVPNNRTPYVTAPPLEGDRAWAMVTGGKRIGPWEKFMIVPVKNAPERIRLFSMAAKRFVTVPADAGHEPELVAGVEHAADTETFTRVGEDESLALLAWNSKYVSAEPSRKPKPLKARADTLGPWEKFSFEPVLP